MKLRISILRSTCLLLVLSMLFIAVSLPALAQSNITLLVHNVTVGPLAGTPAYDVAILLSLLDSAGNPIKDATVENFTLSEDGISQPIVLLQPSGDPINVAIALDASGSMGGEKMTAARMAAGRFIDDLQSSDKVAVFSFSNTLTPHIDFTTDHLAARQQMELVDYIPDGGTCLYDAAYETVQRTAALPSGRRAVILLTDGVDEAGGKPCSYYKLDDVISLASQPGKRVPVYTIGLGDDVDSDSLERLARQTGGRYLVSPGATQLEALFARLSDELRSQYVLHYTSIALAGTHTLAIHVSYYGSEDQVSRDVVMPALPYNISFTAPLEGATVGDSTTLTVVISGQGAPISQVVFLAGGAILGTDDIPPYELVWNVTDLAEGPVLLEAIAQDAGGGELARSAVTVTYQPVSIQPTGEPEKQVGFQLPTLSLPMMIGLAALVFILVGAVIAIIVIAGRKRREDKERDRRWKETVQGESAAPPSVSMDDQTLDIFTPSEDALAVLLVLESDDPSMRGQRFEINQSVTTLGRRSSNDIIFPRDGAVSRQHAVIEEHGGLLYLSEVMTANDAGLPKPPTYGTFINEKQLDAPQVLHHKDEIRLGKRVRIRFDSLHPARSESPGTTDRVTQADKPAEK